MKRSLPLTLSCLFLAAIQCSAQTGGDNPLFRNIPPDATTVFQVNLPVLTSHISWQELTEIIPASKMASGNPSAIAILRDPAMAGIDTGKDFFIAAKDPGADSTGYMILTVHLMDSSKFRTAMRKLEPGLRIYTLPNKNKIRLGGEGTMGVAWSKNLAVLVSIRPPLKEGTLKGGSGSSNYGLIAAKRGLACMRGFDGSFYATDLFFRAGFSDDADAHVWTRQGQGLSMIGKNLLKRKTPMGNYLQTGSAAKPFTLSAIRLEPGRIIITSTAVATPELKTLYEKSNNRSLNMDLQSRIPPGNIMGLLNIRFDPLLINDMMNREAFRKTVLRGKLDSFMTAKGVPLDTLLNAFDGNFQLVCMEPIQSAETKKPKFPIYFVTTIRNPTAFAKVAAAIKALSDSAGVDSVTGKPRNPLANMKSASTFRDNILVISGSKEQSDGWFNNTGKRSMDFLSDRMKTNPISILIDFKTLTDFVETLSKGHDRAPSSKEKKTLDILHSIDRLEITGGALKDDKIESFVELKLTDSSPNSIRDFFKLLH